MQLTGFQIIPGEDIYKFSDEDIKRFQEIIESTAHLILEFSQEGGLENASGF